jgi:AcrR family transcriptional regulator
MARDAQETKRRLLTAAVAEFSAYGIAGARVDRIAATASANKALIYAYFGNKEQLFDAAFDWLVNGTLDNVPINPDDLPGYAGKLFDRFWQAPEIVRMSTWRRLERGDEVTDLVLKSQRDKANSIAEAQRAGKLTLSMTSYELLSLILVISTMWTAGNPDAASSKFITSKKARRQVVTGAVRALLQS